MLCWWWVLVHSGQLGGEAAVLWSSIYWGTCLSITTPISDFQNSLHCTFIITHIIASMSSWLSLMGTTLMCRTTLTKWNEEGPSPSQVASLGEEWVIRLPYLFPFWEYNVTSNCFVHPMHPLAWLSMRTRTGDSSPPTIISYYEWVCC
jgi:hypothetical protein